MEKIFNYTNYRKYLKDYYNHLKQTTAFFSLRYFAAKAGFQSHQMLKFVMDGERNLGDESIEKVIAALKLNKRESNYFRALVNFNQAATEKAKNLHFKELLRYSEDSPLKQLNQAQLEIFGNWYHVPIREMVALEDFREDPAWIASNLRPQIKAADAQRTLALLKKLGILKYDENGRLVQADPIIKSEDEVKSLFLRNFHSQMIQLAHESIERAPREEREISSVTLCLSREEVKEIKTLVSAFEDELLERIAKRGNRHETVYQLNFQFFPMVASKRDAL